MDLRGLISLVAEYERVGRQAAEGLKKFVGPDGALHHQPDIEPPATKTTIRAYTIIEEAGSISRQFSDEFKEKLFCNCKIISEKYLSSAKNGGIQDNKRFLDDIIISRFISIYHNKLCFSDRDYENFSIDIISRINNDFEKYSLNGSSRPHALYAFHARMWAEDASKTGVQNEKKILKINEQLSASSVEQLFRQIAFHSSGEASHFDVGLLGFSLFPSANVLPIGLLAHSINVVGKTLSERANIYLHPYHSDGREHAIATLVEEVSIAFIKASIDYVRKTGQIERIIESVVGSLTTLLQRIDTRRIKTGSGQTLGWPQPSFPETPEAWPTLAVLELSSTANRFLRLAILYSLRERYGFYLEDIVTGDTHVTIYKESPFDLFNVLEKHFLDRTTAPWSSAILFGPPGTGKTSLVKSIAQFLKWKFILITPSDLAQDGPDKIVGRARDLLECLSEVEETVILFDEFDPFMLERDSNNLGSWHALITNCMLPLLANLRESQRSLFFVATNLLSGLDNAATREGRFDAILPIWPLSLAQRKAVLGEMFGCATEVEVEGAAQRLKWATFGELKGRMATIGDNFVPSARSAEKEFSNDLQFARPSVADQYD